MKKKLLLLMVCLLITLFLGFSVVVYAADNVLAQSTEVIEPSDTLYERIIGAAIAFSIVIISWIVLSMFLLKSEPKAVKVNMADRYKELSSDELKILNVDTDDFKVMLYQKFKDIHVALTDYDYDKLKINLTDDLYNYYVEQLEELKNKNHKNIMKDFELVNLKIYRVNDAYGVLQVDIYLNVRMFDYMIDMEKNTFIKGNDHDKIDFEFELTFAKRGKGKGLYNKFVMSKKTCINEMPVEKNDINQ